MLKIHEIIFQNISEHTIYLRYCLFRFRRRNVIFDSMHFVIKAQTNASSGTWSMITLKVLDFFISKWIWSERSFSFYKNYPVRDSDICFSCPVHVRPKTRLHPDVQSNHFPRDWPFFRGSYSLSYMAHDVCRNTDSLLDVLNKKNI